MEVLFGDKKSVYAWCVAIKSTRLFFLSVFVFLFVIYWKQKHGRWYLFLLFYVWILSIPEKVVSWNWGVKEYIMDFNCEQGQNSVVP
jgi:hypothetical protein